ncbi:hypothetical protein BDV96DRAFT_606329 [Lophiotrema nucula]|uniref:DUF7580 domain-containing protein n=1 Tax=Lophiotrema nucula TaxID=690887 RepID=A0A6A5YM54_9PLEO|nr:hypothetical protein BDV96DRAFT_606329 [Lophiotrema nucula]
MVSGIEVAGAILATLPLCIEIAKAYSRGIGSLRNVTIGARRDEALCEFYDEFYWNISEISLHFERISRAVGPNTNSLVAKDDSIIALKLKKYCGSLAAYDQLLVVAKRIALLIAQLIHDDTVSVCQVDLTEEKMFEKLNAFASDRDTGRSTMERADSRAPETRQALVSKHLSITQPWDSLILSINQPSAQLRLLTRDLHTVLSDRWRCPCTEPHEARFCLNLHNHYTTASNPDSDTEIDFLVSSGASTWQEGSVGIRVATSPSGSTSSQLSRFCDTLNVRLAAFRFRLLMEYVNGQHHLWKLDSTARRLPVLETAPPVSMLEVLLGNAKMYPKEKRELAVICAYSLLLLHGTAWLDSTWDKTKLSFFYKANEEPDITRPFISARFGCQREPVDGPRSMRDLSDMHIMTLADFAQLNMASLEDVLDSSMSVSLSFINIVVRVHSPMSFDGP